MTDEPSSGAGAMPQPDPPATGTPAPGSATPPAASLTLEEALKRIAEIEHAHSNAKEELERHRRKLSAYEKKEAEAEAARKAAEDAQLSELERTRKQHAELQAAHDVYVRQMQERLVRYEVERQASKLGIIDPDAATRLLDWSELEYEDDGTPKNARELLEKLLKNKPYLAPALASPPPQHGSSPGGTPPGQQAGPSALRPPTVPAMNPGRSAIAPPNSATPGKPVRLADVYKRPQ